MKIKLNELRNLINEVLLTEGAMSFDEMMSRPDLQKLILIAKDKYSEFLGENLDYEQFKQALFNLENQGIEGTVVYRSTFTFFLISLLSKQGYLLNQDSINNISEFLQLLKNTKSKAYVSRSNFFNTDVINFLSSNGVAVSPKIMNMPLQDRVLKVYDQYQQLAGSDLVSDLLSGVIKENSESITSFAGFEQSFIDYCIQEKYWFPITSNLGVSNIGIFYISNSREFEKNYKSLLYACNIQDEKRPYNELAADVKRDMSDNQYIKDVPDDVYLVMKNNDTYKIRETANWCIKSAKILKGTYNAVPGMILVLDNNKAFDDPDGCLLISVKHNFQLDNTFNASDNLIPTPDYLTNADTFQLISDAIAEIDDTLSITKKLSKKDAALARFYKTFKEEFYFEMKDFNMMEFIEKKDLVTKDINYVLSTNDYSKYLLDNRERFMWNENFNDNSKIVENTGYTFEIKDLTQFTNESFYDVEGKMNFYIRRNKKLILPYDNMNIALFKNRHDLIDLEDLNLFPLNNTSDLMNILNLISSRKINRMYEENKLTFLEDRSVRIKFKANETIYNQNFNESSLRQLIRGYIRLLK